jgi:hypothetical protein
VYIISELPASFADSWTPLPPPPVEAELPTWIISAELVYDAVPPDVEPSTSDDE